ncbi:MAG: glycosyltransferase family 4 protein [Patescibacteria group bacterium]
MEKQGLNSQKNLSKTKLLVFCGYYPPHIGGSESHSEEFNKHLIKSGDYEVVVFTSNLPRLDYYRKEREVKVIRFPAFELISNYPFPKFWHFVFWRQLNALRREDFDIVVSRIRFFPTSLIALFFAKIKKIPWVHIEHSSDFVSLESGWKSFLSRIYDKIIGRTVFRCSDLNISISEAVKKFVNKFDSRHSPVVYRGLDLSEESAGETALSQMEDEIENKILIVTVARLYKWKGVNRGMEAVKKLPSKWKEKVVYVVIGDGEDREILKKKADGEGNIHFTGFLPRKETLSFLERADIYLHTSFPGGGLSTSLLEAMRKKCAVVASPREGADEVLDEDNGFLLKQNFSAGDMAQKVEFLCKDDTIRKKFAENAQKTIKERFNWDKSIQEYKKIFNQIRK